MTHDSRSPPAAGTDPVGIIAPHLAAPEEPIRCAAARALGALGDENAAPALVGALADADPDVRSDAMAALERCARPRDAAAIRRSLADDPVADVKTAAVRALCRLEDEASVEVLRALSNDRCEPRIAWEPPDEGWDDWLDVQVAAIAALGEMRVEAAVGDLLRARGDETGQDLDHVVFGALAKMPVRGTGALLDFLGDGDPRVRRRALAALSRSGSPLPATVCDRLVRDPAPDVRALAVERVEAADDLLARCALRDPSALVRRAALARIAPSRPDIVRSAADDPDDGVRAAALEAVPAPPGLSPESRDKAFPDGASGLAGKARAWLRTADASLAVTCASVLPKLVGADALDALRGVAAGPERAPEVRVAALRAMGETGSGDALDALGAAAADPVRQVRVAALAVVGEMARTAPGDARARARTLLIDAVRSGLRRAEAPAPVKGAGGSGRTLQESRSLAARPEDRTVTGGLPASKARTEGLMNRSSRLPESLGGSGVSRPPEPGPPESGPTESGPGSLSVERAAPSSGDGGDGAGPSQPRVSGASAADAGSAGEPYPRSTLEAIRASSPRPVRETPASPPAGHAARSPRRGASVPPRRIAVGGCDDIAGDIRLAAIRTVAECAGEGIDEALAEAAGSVPPGAHAEVLESIARRAEAMRLSPGLVMTLRRFLRHPDARVRAAAARAVASTGADAHRILAPLVTDSDAAVRAAAFGAVAGACPARAVDGIEDPAPAVRRAAVEAMVAHRDPALLAEGLRKVVHGGWSDTLIDACRRHPDACRRVLPGLLAPRCTRRAALMILDALGHAVA